MSMLLLVNIAGIAGVICFLLAYVLLQMQRVGPTGVHYLGLNLAGALLVMFSLLFEWNLPSFLLEAAWASISMYGIYVHIYRRKQDSSTPHEH